MKIKTKTLLAAAVAATLAGTVAQASDSVRHEAQALDKAGLSLSEAIRRAEKEGNGQAISAEFEFKRGNPAYYEVKVLREDGRKLTRYDLNPHSGRIKETSNEEFEKLFTRIRPESIQHAPTSLSRAIGTAEERFGGKATEAQVERDGDQVRYTVTVARLDGSSEKFRINGADGKIASAR